MKKVHILCPNCGFWQDVGVTEWRATWAVRWTWFGKKKGYGWSPGPDEVIPCRHCTGKYPAHQWHRQLERHELPLLGHTTPYLQREGAPKA